MKFVFKLEPVLRQRQREERDRQLAVAAIERERLGVEEKLRQIQASIEGAKAEMRALLSPRTAPEIAHPTFIPAQASASLHLESQARLAALGLAGIYKRLERARAELLRAATARRAVELLRERRYQEWRIEVNRADARQVDEAATQGFLRSATP